MKKAQKIIGKIVNVLIVIVVIAILFCAYCVFSIKVLNNKYVNVFGYSIFEVATGSMHGSIEVDDAVLVKIGSEYKAGDIVTYQNGDDFITHRVVSIEGDKVITKGDANNVNDNPIESKYILGKVVKVIPRLGVWKKVLLTPKVIILILVTLFIFSIMFAYDGKAIKIITSKKAEEEMDNKINDEVNKKVAVITRKKRRSKKVLDATQIIDINEVNKALENSNKKTKKTLDATQIIDIREIKKKVG
jgi:signal peptidase